MHALVYAPLAHSNCWRGFAIARRRQRQLSHLRLASTSRAHAPEAVAPTGALLHTGDIVKRRARHSHASTPSGIEECDPWSKKRMPDGCLVHACACGTQGAGLTGKGSETWRARFWDCFTMRGVGVNLEIYHFYFFD